ncbi:hypothetical protein MKEN_00033600 [Mycena kentingensis (nom. inval.)]|nr:hypothetical protein MKEN_00033600 [Mycena kentingensis (nom. inval.)]
MPILGQIPNPMHPHFYHGFHHFRRGPSRILWFTLGAASAAWFVKRREAHQHTTDRHFGRCWRPPVGSLPQPNSDEWKLRDLNNIPHATATEAPPPPSPLPWGYPEAHRERQWDEEKAKLQAVGRQAEDVMTKLSEDALDSVMSAMEALKRKLAEHRAERDRTQRELEKKFEDEKNSPHRFV